MHFDLRVGVNTGEVLAGAVGEAYTVVGDTVNVAARLQSAARPGSVTVGERTMRATSDAVRYEPLEPARAEGQVRAGAGLGGARGDRRARPGAARPRRASRRWWAAREELATLAALYERVKREGTAHLVTLVGEAGVGKSRLLRELERRLGRPARRAPRSTPAAACPTAAASSSGRSAR